MVKQEETFVQKLLKLTFYEKSKKVWQICTKMDPFFVQSANGKRK